MSKRGVKKMKKMEFTIEELERHMKEKHGIDLLLAESEEVMCGPTKHGNEAYHYFYQTRWYVNGKLVAYGPTDNCILKGVSGYYVCNICNPEHPFY